LARKSALSAKAAENAIVVVEDFNLETPSTKAFVNVVKNLQVADKKLLFVLNSQNNNVLLSARNLKKVNVMQAANLNTYAVLNSNAIVLSESAVESVNNL
jgi:large subunit ribosomal protein L4